MRKNKALRRLIKAARREEADAMYRLALVYEKGKSLPEDKGYAAELMARAAALGYKPAKDWVEDYSFDDSALVQAES